MKRCECCGQAIDPVRSGRFTDGDRWAAYAGYRLKVHEEGGRATDIWVDGPGWVVHDEHVPAPIMKALCLHLCVRVI